MTKRKSIAMPDVRRIMVIPADEFIAVMSAVMYMKINNFIHDPELLSVKVKFRP